jgi:Sulfotransferase family
MRRIGKNHLVTHSSARRLDDSMISHYYQCIFVHQRKCAGVSIITAFGGDWKFATNGVLSQEWTKQSDLIRRYFKFAVIRNPWDRFVSGWKYLPSTRDRDLIDVLRDPPTEGFDYRHLTRPQFVTLFNQDGSLAVDYLIRFETIEEGFRQVCQRIGKVNSDLPYLNRGMRPPYREVFNAEARRLFEARFSEDIRRFGYSFTD